MAHHDDSVERDSPSKKILRQTELTKKPNWPVELVNPAAQDPSQNPA